MAEQNSGSRGSPDPSAGERHLDDSCSDPGVHQQEMAELRRSQRYLEQAQRLSGTGSWAWSVSTRQFVHWSKEHYRLHGRDPEQGPPSWEAAQQLIHPDDREACLQAIDRAVQTKTVCDMEYRSVLPDGSIKYISSWAQPVFDSAGELVEFVGTEMDISQQKRLEEQFRQAQKMEAVGQLAGGIAHDFNNLLTVINGCTEILLTVMPAADPNREMLKQIYDAGDRARSLTQQLLAFSRKTVLEPKLLDLGQVVRNNERLLQRVLGEHVQLSVLLEPDAAPVKADPAQISQVLMNLAVNARDALPTGGQLTIAISNIDLQAEQAAAIDPAAKPGHYVRVAVRDNGTGMPAEVRARVFEPFFTTKPVGKGTGLGLAMVYGIVTQSGGFIAVDTELDRGTTFHLYFPAAEGTLAHSDEKATGPSAQAARRDEAILLVEDEPGVRTFIRTVLRNAGYFVLEAADGKQALRIAAEEQTQIHLVITDVVMPEMNGPQLVEHLRLARSDIKVLYVSGYGDNAALHAGAGSGNVAFLQKPFSILALKDKVRELLDEPS